MLNYNECNEDVIKLCNDFLSKMHEYPIAYVNMAFNMAQLTYDKLLMLKDAEKYYKENEYDKTSKG